MKYVIICFLLVTTLISCKLKTEGKRFRNCTIKYDSLFKKIDTLNLEITRNTDSAEIEVLDKQILGGERGLMRFDKKGNLSYYAFLYNDHNDTDFYIRIDSLGNLKRSTNSEAVFWNFDKRIDDTIKFSVLLCAIDRNYGDIKVESGNFKKENIILYESSFTKIICASMRINRKDLDKSKKVYISGFWEDKCTKQTENFIDSTIIPEEL